jgi:hypothetical protein
MSMIIALAETSVIILAVPHERGQLTAGNTKTMRFFLGSKNVLCFFGKMILCRIPVRLE